ELGGGALFDVTCYAINVARWLLASEPRALRALARLRSPGVDESTHAVLEFENSVMAQVAGSLNSAPDQGVTILGTEATLEVVRPFAPHWDPTLVRVHRSGGTETHEIGGANHFLHQVEHFASLVLDATRPLDPAEDGVDNVIACCAVRSSYESA